MVAKRSHEDAFKRKPLHNVKLDDFHARYTAYKVLEPCVLRYDNRTEKGFLIKTMQNFEYKIAESIIKETGISGTSFTSQKKATKTELIELFSNLSVNDIWSATFFKQDLESNWSVELVTKIQSMEKDVAEKYVKKNFTKFGKILRDLVGQKIVSKSDNNYYMVRDLNVHFNELIVHNDPETAAKNSIRRLDVNMLQSLIFNNVKYTLKK